MTENTTTISNNRIFQARDKQWQLGKQTLVIGIINVTPDSFSDGGESLTTRSAIAKGLEHYENGADIIDVGGESTRPGSDPVTSEEELKRVIPVIEELTKQTDAAISIDTYKSEVAVRALEVGAHMVNDISAGNFDSTMADVVARFNAGVVLMHIKGQPKSMQHEIVYDDLIGELRYYFEDAVERFTDSGVDMNNILVDPGIGFGKLVEHNLLLINNLIEFKDIAAGVLLGPSRKSFIGKITGRDVKDRLSGTIASVVIGVAKGADAVRVHDVKEVKDALKVANEIIHAGYEI